MFPLLCGFLLTSSPSLFTLNLKSAFSRGFSFRKQQIFISQTTDSHFANYRFSFRKLQIFISFRCISFRFAPFPFANCSKPFQLCYRSNTDCIFRLRGGCNCARSEVANYERSLISQINVAVDENGLNI